MDITETNNLCRMFAGQYKLLNDGEYSPCKDDRIGSIIEYLSQFPPNWSISVGAGLSEPVLMQNGVETKFDSTGYEVAL